MRALLLTPLLLAGACDRSEEAAAPVAPRPAPAAVQPVSPADAERMLQEKAVTGLRAILPDPEKARFADLRSGTAGAVCGKVDTEQPDGKRSGLKPFVVTPDGVGVISLTPTVMLNDPEDIFPDYHIRWCASTAELVQLEVAPPPDNLATRIGDLPPDLPELAEAPPPVPDAPAAPPATPPATSPDELESFSRAVIRQQPPKN